MSRDTLRDCLLVVSLVVFSWTYGFSASAMGLFPSDFVMRAWHQGRRLVVGPPPGWTGPAFHDWSGARTEAPGEAQGGLTLVSSHWEDLGWRPGLKLMDRGGTVVHEWLVDPPELFEASSDRGSDVGTPFERRQIHGFHLFRDGDVLVNVEDVGMVRLDPCGEVIWKLPVGSHHSISVAGDGSIWFPMKAHPDSVRRLVRTGAFPGVRESWEIDRIGRISDDGRLLEEISLLRVLYSNGLERLIPKMTRPGATDVMHVNDVEPLLPSVADEYPLFESGDLLVSFRSLNLVLVFDPATLKVRWHSSAMLVHQHDPDFMGGGWIGVFDNSRDGTHAGSMLGGSRIIALQPHTDSTRVIFPTSQSGFFYTGIMGEWQRLQNGNLLLTESMFGRVVEVDSSGRTVWEWVHERYDDSNVPWVTGSSRVPVTRDAAATWSCTFPAPPERVRGAGS